MKSKVYSMHFLSYDSKHSPSTAAHIPKSTQAGPSAKQILFIITYIYTSLI